MDIVDRLKQTLARALVEAGIKINARDISLLHPKELSHGDYASGAALQYAKQEDVPPLALAEKIAASLGKISGVARAEAVKPGFINFYLSPDSINGILAQAIGEPDKWGRNDSQKGARVMVEYTDPNPFKEFHIGHLMSNAIGESIARLLEYSGADVKRANYQGDIGLHVAKAIYAYRHHTPSVENEIVKWGLAYKVGNDLYESNEEAKREIDNINQRIYAHNQELSALYNAGRQISLDYFETIYAKLGMEERDHFGEKRHFDYYFFESASWEIGKALVQQNTPEVFEKSEGAYVFHGEKLDESLHTRVFITSQGLPTYEAKELGLLKSKIDKWGWNFDESITITGNEQQEYFKVVLAAAKQIQELRDAANKTKHVVHGMMRFADGKMSSRTGNVITALGLLQELFDVAKERAKESRANEYEKLAHDVALAGVKYQILRQASGKNIIFDRERALSLDGDSGPYLQYAHARAKQIVERARTESVILKLNLSAEPNDVSRLITRFPEAIETAANELEPHLLVNYLIALASAFNSWYAQVHILDGTKDAPHKVAVADAIRATLRNGLWLLGISAPEKM